MEYIVHSGGKETMKPITDNEGNKLYGYSVNDLQQMIGLQKQQIKSLNRLIRWKQVHIAVSCGAMAVMLYLVFWIDYHDVLSRLIGG